MQYLGLRNTTFATLVAQVDEHSSEMQKLLKREGPKYQYGSGCLSDGVIGAWMARIYGIDTPLAQGKIRTALQAIFKNNFKTDLSQHANAQRPGYAMGHEPGLLLCTWPYGSKPTLPFVYSDEVWTGIEYQVASHLISEGFVKEGLTIVKALRSRYDGRIRNPWNEYECGNYYARAMASYALLGALSGFRYSAAQRTLWFGPQVSIRPFKTFFSAASGFGSIALDDRSVRIQMLEGELWRQSCTAGVRVTGDFIRQLLGFPPASSNHQAGADYYQRNACGWREEVAVLGVHTQVDVAGVECVVLGVGDRDKEGENAED